MTDTDRPALARLPKYVTASDGTVSTEELAHLSGVPFRMLDYCTRTYVHRFPGPTLLRPRHAARGSGSRRRWDPREVCVVLTCTKVTEMFPGYPFTAVVKDLGDQVRHAYDQGLNIVDVRSEDRRAAFTMYVVTNP